MLFCVLALMFLGLLIISLLLLITVLYHLGKFSCFYICLIIIIIFYTPVPAVKKLEAKNKYHWQLEVWIFVSGTEGIHNEDRVEALYNHREALESKKLQGHIRTEKVKPTEPKPCLNIYMSTFFQLVFQYYTVLQL